MNPPRRERHAHRDDRGFTILEVLVGMTIMSIFMAIFGGAMVSMFRSADRTQSTAYAQSTRNQVFVKLDREIRYASGISAPGVDTAGNPSVEWSNSTTTNQVCTQLRLADNTLQARSWVQPDDVTAAVTMGQTTIIGTGLNAGTPNSKASNDVKISGPFATISAAGDTSNQRLEIAVVAFKEQSAAANNTSRSRNVTMTFTAQNTGTSTSSSSVCSAGRRIAWPSPSAP